jgi:hypothetical protein
MNNLSSDEQLAKLLGQTAKIPWHELQMHFARGAIVVVDSELDLMKIARLLIANDSEAIRSLQDRSLLRGPENAEAARWFDEGANFWAIVIAPWVLIQGPV